MEVVVVGWLVGFCFWVGVFFFFFFWFFYYIIIIVTLSDSSQDTEKEPQSHI